MLSDELNLNLVEELEMKFEKTSKPSPPPKPSTLSKPILSKPILLDIKEYPCDLCFGYGYTGIRIWSSQCKKCNGSGKIKENRCIVTIENFSNSVVSFGIKMDGLQSSLMLNLNSIKFKKELIISIKEALSENKMNYLTEVENIFVIEIKQEKIKLCDSKLSIELDNNEHNRKELTKFFDMLLEKYTIDTVE